MLAMCCVSSVLMDMSGSVLGRHRSQAHPRLSHTPPSAAVHADTVPRSGLKDTGWVVANQTGHVPDALGVEEVTALHRIDEKNKEIDAGVDILAHRVDTLGGIASCINDEVLLLPKLLQCVMTCMKEVDRYGVLAY